MNWKLIAFVFALVAITEIADWLWLSYSGLPFLLWFDIGTNGLEATIKSRWASYFCLLIGVFIYQKYQGFKN